jgi:hypothetical protein
MRSLTLGLFWPIAASTAIGQNSWSYIAEASELFSRVLDINEYSDSYFIASNQFTLGEQQTGEVYIVKLDASGSPGLQKRLWPNSALVSAENLVHIDDQEHLVVLGSARDVSQSGYFFSHVLDYGLNTVDSAAFPSQFAYSPFADNAIRTEQGDILFAGSGLVEPGAPFDRLYLFKLTSMGQVISEFVQTNSSLLIPRDVLEFSEDSFMVTTTGIPDATFGNWSWASYWKFGADLDPNGGFLSEASDGSGAPLTFSNAIADIIHVERLESGNIISCGRPRAGQLRTILVKLSPRGEWLGAFRPQSEFPEDHPAAYGAIAQSGDHILVASMENYFQGQMTGTPLLPDHPNQIKIFKLDTALNQICTNTIDGFTENAYYWVDRIKSTSDGGYILCGGRKDLNDQNSRMVGWVQKFAPQDCFVSIPEENTLDLARITPNPGNDHFQVDLNGPIRRATLQLFDQNGRLVQVAVMHHNSVVVETPSLSPGIYAYQLVDQHSGRRITGGRWVKAP